MSGSLGPLVAVCGNDLGPILRSCTIIWELVIALQRWEFGWNSTKQQTSKRRGNRDLRASLCGQGSKGNLHLRGPVWPGGAKQEFRFEGGLVWPGGTKVEFRFKNGLGWPVRAEREFRFKEWWCGQEEPTGNVTS